MKKKLIRPLAAVLVLMIIMAVTFTGCGSDELSSGVEIATLNGPTGMGMVELMNDENVNITTYQSPNEAVSKLLAGEADMAAVPSNLAAILNTKTKGDIVAVTNLAYGMLSILGNDTDISDLKSLEGKTIVASGQGGTPEYVLGILLDNAGVKAEIKWLANHGDVAQALLAKKGTIALLPEPFVSTAAAKSKDISVIADLDEAWNEFAGTDMPMGTLITTKEFAAEKGEDIDILIEKLKASVDKVNSADEEVIAEIVEKGFIADKTIAEKAIPGCMISCTDSETTRNDLDRFYNELFKKNPASVGGEVPGEDFYY